VRVGGHVYGIPLGAVVEVTRMVALAAPPGGSPEAAGLLDLRGAPVPVVDVAPCLGLVAGAPILDRRIVVTRDPDGPAGLPGPGDPGDAVGLVVDEVTGIGPPGPPLLDVGALRATVAAHG
jgi:chemotaxis-related protein WspB